MKKILLLLLAITFNLSQGQTYTINSQLKLNTVSAGSVHDSILVRGNDKIIKYLPASDLIDSKYPLFMQGVGSPYINSDAVDFLNENLGKELIYYNLTDNQLFIYDYTTSDWNQANKNELAKQTLDSYNGTRLIPNDNSLNGYHIQQSKNKNIGFSVVNEDAIGNASQANVTVKGAGALYTNNTGISHYNANYYVTWLRNSGLFYSDRPLFVATWNDHPIEFRTGSAFTNLTAKFKINANGQLNIGVEPTINNSVNSILGRDTAGNIVTVTNALISTATVPTSSTSAGINGQIAFDSNYAYICTATNTWARFPLTTTF